MESQGHSPGASSLLMRWISYILVYHGRYVMPEGHEQTQRVNRAMLTCKHGGFSACIEQVSGMGARDVGNALRTYSCRSYIETAVRSPADLLLALIILV